MKIAIGSKGQTINDEVSEVCGRAPYFLIFENKELVDVIDNPFRKGGGGAGAGMAKLLLDKGSELIICGKFGGHMQEWLEDKKVPYQEVKGKLVKEVIAEQKQVTYKID